MIISLRNPKREEIMSTDQEKQPALDDNERKKMEVRSFLFLAIFLAPAVAVAFVGSLGLFIWISQIIVGPPGPPA